MGTGTIVMSVPPGGGPIRICLHPHFYLDLDKPDQVQILFRDAASDFQLLALVMDLLVKIEQASAAMLPDVDKMDLDKPFETACTSIIEKFNAQYGEETVDRVLENILASMALT